MSLRAEIQLPFRPVLSHSADAVLAGDLLFVAGVLPVDQAGRLVGEDDIRAQADRVFDDLAAIVGAGGCEVADIARLNVYLTDILEAGPVDVVQRLAFGEARPAGAVVGVTGLAVPGATDRGRRSGGPVARS